MSLLTKAYRSRLWLTTPDSENLLWAHSDPVPHFNCSYQLLVVLQVCILCPSSVAHGLLARNPERTSYLFFVLLFGSRDKLIDDLIRHQGVRFRALVC